MIIKSMQVRNFRCIRDETLSCDKLTAIVGPNGSGKSTFLRALELFYTAVARYSEEDFFGGNTGQPIRVTVTYTDLNTEEKALFEKYLEGDNLTVEKVMGLPCVKASQKYHGTSLRNADFTAFRAATSANDRKQCYNALREQPKYATLPVWSRQEEAAKRLSEWEVANPSECTRDVDDGQFFGFTEVGQAHLERYNYFLLIPAVRDAASDAAEGRGSVLSQLMDLVVRSVLEQQTDLVQLRQDVQQRYEQIVDPVNLPELQRLAGELTATLKGYAPGARPTAIFQAFGISVYTIWDSDCGTGSESEQANSKRTNHRLLRLCGVHAEDWPETVSTRHACFKAKLGKTMRSEIGEVRFDKLVQKCAQMFDYDRPDAIKSPQVMRAVVLDAQGEAVVSPTLAAIVQAIVAMKG